MSTIHIELDNGVTRDSEVENFILIGEQDEEVNFCRYGGMLDVIALACKQAEELTKELEEVGTVFKDAFIHTLFFALAKTKKDFVDASEIQEVEQ